METEYLLGNVAIAHGCLEAGVDYIAGYPGTPSSEVIDWLRSRNDRPYTVEWSVNEKVAFENALAAAWCGVRALCTMKHVGLNVAADPLMTSSYTGVTGGFVILAADDPFAHSSQNEQDSRCYAKFAQIPCLDPSTVQEAHDMVRDAFALSEEFGLPVLFRPTTRVCHSKSTVEVGEPSGTRREGSFRKNPRQYVVIPAHTRPLHKILLEKQPEIRRRLLRAGYNRATVRGDTAVITGGVSATYVAELIPGDVSTATIGGYPVDEEWLGEFVSRHRQVLVVEEGHPVIEELVRQVAGDTVVHGKMDGIVPATGELSLLPVARALEAVGIRPSLDIPDPEPVTDVPPRPPILCAGCPHRAMFYAIRKVYRDAIYPGDIGCYTLGLQLGAVDTTICMGASITVGSGIYHSGERRDIICTIGDSTFLHTGIQGLMNAVYNGADMTVVILDNRITAMTGHQPNPVTGYNATGTGTPPVSLEAVCRACGVQYVRTVDPYDYYAAIEALKEAQDRSGVRVIISSQPCVIKARSAGIRRGTYRVDPDRCTSCMVCVRFGCPAIEFGPDGARITDLCSGCGVCAQLCPSGAIVKEGRS
ncbi:MAG: indolepyruvate ferredoxin oxidoreductase subunit alpha [Methanoculleaceae archaeon]